ncbi:hypothetical protein TYRP_021275 [Tyrophagus putrescentiae]|nr:hypothetical protein TYRP_021275 [Tyrophagus putrescentiae]
MSVWQYLFLVTGVFAVAAVVAVEIAEKVGLSSGLNSGKVDGTFAEALASDPETTIEGDIEVGELPETPARRRGLPPAVHGNGRPEEHRTGQPVEEDAADDEERSSQAVFSNHRLNEGGKDKRPHRSTGLINNNNNNNKSPLTRSRGRVPLKVLRNDHRRLHVRQSIAEAVNHAHQQYNMTNVSGEKAGGETGGGKDDAHHDDSPQVEVADEEAGNRSAEVGAAGAEGKGPGSGLPADVELRAEVEEEDAKGANQAKGEAVDGADGDGDDPRPAGVRGPVAGDVHRIINTLIKTLLQTPSPNSLIIEERHDNAGHAAGHRLQHRVVAAVNDGQVNQRQNVRLRKVGLAPHVISQLIAVRQQPFRDDASVNAAHAAHAEEDQLAPWCNLPPELHWKFKRSWIFADVGVHAEAVLRNGDQVVVVELLGELIGVQVGGFRDKSLTLGEGVAKGGGQLSLILDQLSVVDLLLDGSKLGPQRAVSGKGRQLVTVEEPNRIAAVEVHPRGVGIVQQTRRDNVAVDDDQIRFFSFQKGLNLRLKLRRVKVQLLEEVHIDQPLHLLKGGYVFAKSHLDDRIADLLNWVEGRGGRFPRHPIRVLSEKVFHKGETGELSLQLLVDQKVHLVAARVKRLAHSNAGVLRADEVHDADEDFHFGKIAIL